MRVLLLGYLLDASGWARASCDYALALDAAGVDVVCRPVRLNASRHPVPQRINELIEKPATGCDVLLSHLLPHQTEPNGRFRRSIGLYASETSNLGRSCWADRLNEMDEVWCINRAQARATRDSGVSCPITVMPHACDVERFERSYKPLPLISPLKEQGEFLFYTLGEFTRRKNLAALLKAFHTEFDPSENVRLVIKTSVPGAGAEEARQAVGKFCEEIKRGLKLYGGNLEPYKPEIIITERLTDHGILQLHSTCDCFVQPSYGEAWSIPAFDAMTMGRTPIVTACTGYLDYVSEETGWLVDGQEEPCFGVTDTFTDIFTGHETWFQVNIMHLRRCMRQAFQDSELRKKKAAAGIARAYDFSYEAVGSRMREALET